MSNNQVDITIIGAGMVGSTLVHALKSLPYKIAVIDQKPLFKAVSNTNSDPRGIALSDMSVRLLQQWGLWQLLQQHATAMQSIHTSEQGRFGFVQLTAEQAGLESLGAIVEGQALLHTLTSELQQNCVCHAPSEVVQLQQIETGWELRLEDENVISTKLLVIADGAQSSFRNLVGIETIIDDYKQLALVSNIQLASLAEGRAYQRFCEQGVLALLPFGAHNMKCVWTVSKPTGLRFSHESAEKRLARVQEAIGYRLGRLTAISKPTTYPLIAVRAKRLTAHHAVVIGNAANTIHPIAAQGFNLGIRDVAWLVESIKQLGHQLSSYDVDKALNYYTENRVEDHQQTQQFIQRLVDTFHFHKTNPITRRIGFLACEFVKPLKQLLLAQGAGWRAPLPNLK